MVDRPGWRITLTTARRDEFGTHAQSQRIAGIVSHIRALSPGLGPVRIEVSDSVPPHAGFGSGTQLALAIGRGLSMLAGRPEAGSFELARLAGRGARSAIGIHGFERGGLIVDAGRRTAEGAGELACREAVPDVWRFVLVTPPHEGLSGDEERTAFERLPPMPPSLTGRLCRLVLCDVLPALQRGDFERFSAAVTEYGALVGSYFAPVQGGVFSDSRMPAVAELAAKRFGCGCAQTSWGPSVAVLCPDPIAAEGVAAAVRRDARWQGCTVTIAAALNRGAACHLQRSGSPSPRGAG